LASAFMFFLFLRPVTMQLLDRQLQIPYGYSHLFADAAGSLEVFSADLV